MALKSLLLDIGQVLVALDYDEIVARLQRASSLSVDGIRERLTECPDLLLYETGRLSTADFVRRMFQYLNLRASEEEFCEAWGSLFVRESDRVISRPLFRALREQYRLIALSNTNELHFRFLSDHFPLVREFDDYVLSYQVGSAKPDRGIYEIALQRARVPPAQVLFVDDRAENISAARALGMNGLIFTGEDRLRQDLRELGIELAG